MPLTKEKLEDLLKWLGPNRDAAGERYTVIQRGLIAIFAAQGFSDAEGLADEAINRVAAKLPQIAADYDGDPARYFRGVARNIILETKRRKEVPTDTLPERPIRNIEVSDHYKCLLECLKFCTSRQREFILDYHVYEGADKISHHREMAKELDVSPKTLRVKAFRARLSLEKCVRECVERSTGNEISLKQHSVKRLAVEIQESEHR